MTDQVAAATRGRTVIAARCGDHGPTPPARGPGGAGAARAGASRQSTGRCGEDLAATYLGDIGWKILERNWRPDHGLRGELDIIALEPAPAHHEPGSARVADPAEAWAGPRLVIVEVKTRSSLRQGPPAAAVDSRKVARLRALAAAWASTHETPPHAGMRLDVVSILLRDARPALLRHHRAVDASWG
ncbi:YraN family protein [Actinomyces oris]|uniref:UPF0102 protein BKH32_02590 n=1 Tax=Actinomyces oris TaxID=544580 RepID=A0A1Q8I301_9ACTO|nr:YraN family protein [Actinomyces oris]OLL15437.1 endonuclease [Actinomyces oris]